MMLVALRLAKSGYYNGDPDKVLKGKVSHVISLMEYERFIHRYEEAYTELNKKGD